MKEVLIRWYGRRYCHTDYSLMDRMKKADMHLYTGEIRREKVIAYFDGRSEKEIIQYGSVKNIKEIGFKTYEEIVDPRGKSK